MKNSIGYEHIEHVDHRWIAFEMLLYNDQITKRKTIFI